MNDSTADTVLAVLTMVRNGRFAEIHEMFSPSLRPLVTPDAIATAWQAATDRYGPVSAIGSPVGDPVTGGIETVKVPVTFARGALTLIVSVTGTEHLAGLRFAPAEAATPGPAAPRGWSPPPYADSTTFEDRDVMVGEGPLAVPGTLSLPRLPERPDGERPAVRTPGLVLLGGSGPTDRDSTIGPNKPFKDLAWGLATRGVAVLRFDKLPNAHPAEVRGNPDFTLTDEYVPDALAAVALLRRQPGIDPDRVFVLGHSLGGTVAPRVAAAAQTAAAALPTDSAVTNPASTDSGIAGLVIAAGGAQPLYWAAVRQVRYIAALDPETVAAAEPVIATMTRQAEAVDSPDLSPSTPTTELPFGIPAAYWLDLRGYDPVGLAAIMDQPMLIVQGGRDYQATVDDDLALWRTGLAGRENVTIRVYDKDNHTFFAGTGPSTPADYDTLHHVDPAVVTDIADWLWRTGDRPTGGDDRGGT